MGERRQAVRGEMWIWVILAVTGAVSTALAAAGGAAANVAPWVYATLPVLVGGFSARWRWTG